MAQAKTNSTPNLIQPPQEVQQAIQNASNKSGVPIDLLTGIWRVESKSSFPNNYANGLGYGGLFGTQVAAPFGPASSVKAVPTPPTQQQADTAAQILAKALYNNGWNTSKALSVYSGGGYTSVPGQITGSGGTAFTIEEITKMQQVATGATWYPSTSNVQSQINSVAAAPGNIASGVGNAVGNALGLSGVGKDIFYGFMILIGGGIMLGGFVLVAADLGLSAFAAAKNAPGVKHLSSRQDAATQARSERQAQTDELRTLRLEEARRRRESGHAERTERMKEQKLRAQVRVSRARARKAEGKRKMPSSYGKLPPGF